MDCDVFDDRFDYRVCYREEGSFEDFQRVEYVRFFRELFSPWEPLFRREWAKLDFGEEHRNSTTEERRPSVEARLHEHCKKLRNLSANWRQSNIEFREAVGTPSNLTFLEEIETNFQSDRIYKKRTAFPTLVALFAPFWIRAPREWDGVGGIKGFLEHIFCRHQVPASLFSPWESSMEWVEFKWLYWFILIGQGGSLKRASQYFGWLVTQKFQHLLLEAPEMDQPEYASAYAEVRRLGGTPADFERVAATRMLLTDPTDYKTTPDYRKFWRESVLWLIEHRDEMTDQECQQIMAWGVHEYTETERRGAKRFSWKGRNVRAALERARQYRRILDNPWLSYAWHKQGWDWAFVEVNGCEWTFVELTSGGELRLEGDELHHCVASYASLCVNGDSAIVSLRRNGVRTITIEIDPQTGKVLQARGACNRSINTQERQVISRWVSEVVLSKEAVWRC